jgi:hypothetical protein
MCCADRVAIRDINEAVRLAHRDNCMEAMNRAESNLRGSMWLALVRAVEVQDCCACDSHNASSALVLCVSLCRESRKYRRQLTLACAELFIRRASSNC